MNSFVQHPKITAALQAHFPDASNEERDQWSSEIYDAWTISGDLESVERSDRPATKDLESIEKIEKNLRKAAAEFRLLGWYGCGAIRRVTLELSKRKTSNSLPMPDSILKVGEIYSDILEDYADQLSEAAKKIPNEAGSILTLIGYDKEDARRVTKHAKTTAEFTARECAYAFEALAKEPATVRVNYTNNKAYGPFLDFVTAVFRVLEIDASPEVWAKKVRNKPPKN